MEVIIKHACPVLFESSLGAWLFLFSPALFAALGARLLQGSFARILGGTLGGGLRDFLVILAVTNGWVTVSNPRYAFAQALEPVLGNAIGLGQKGLIRNRFVVLRHAEMPSVLVETAFLTNPSEGAKLSDPEFQKVIAQQLAGGLANYMRGAYASRGRRPVE